MSWMDMESETTLTGEARTILDRGGRHKQCNCPGYGSCACTAAYLVGTMISKGYTVAQVRATMLDSRNKGAEFITLQVDPVAAFIDTWNYCAKDDEVHEEPPTEDEQRATLLFLIETRPGIGTQDLRRRSKMRHDTASKHLKWLVEQGFVRRDESGRGRKVAHYRTGEPYGPLDGVRLREYQNLWFSRVYGWDADVVHYVVSQEKMQTYWVKKLAQYVSQPNYEAIDVERFLQICSLNEQTIQTLAEQSEKRRAILSGEWEEETSLSAQD